MHVQVGLGQQPLELGVLGFELALGFRHLHAAELGAPLVESGIAEAAVAAQLLDRHTRFGLPQEPNVICSSLKLLFYMSVILLVVDGLH